MEEPQRQEDHLDRLRITFGHNNFKPMQWEIIQSIIMDRQDNCVVMKTGYGKSLIYQYSAVFRGGLTVVISPLISLMQDQVNSLTKRGISACLLGSAQPRNLIPEILAGNFRIVYLTPEYGSGKGLGELLNLLKLVVNQLQLIAIDEVHCMVKWGRNFRPLYSVLGEIRNELKLSGVPILAVTAVATPRVREDTVTTLGLRNAQIWSTGFDRPNLKFHVRTDFSLNKVLELINQIGAGSIIIYCPTRALTDNMATFLSTIYKDACEKYHPGIPVTERCEAQSRFMENPRGIIVTTVAFGMGIDKPDVRLVIHYGVPMEFETYYLQVGQAGRDGNLSQCVMFWEEDNFNFHRFLRFKNLEEETDQYRDTNELHERQKTILHEFVTTRDCRRNIILEYFGDPTVALNNPNCCDNCEAALAGRN